MILEVISDFHSKSELQQILRCYTNSFSFHFIVAVVAFSRIFPHGDDKEWPSPIPKFVLSSLSFVDGGHFLSWVVPPRRQIRIELHVHEQFILCVCLFVCDVSGDRPSVVNRQCC